MIDSRTRELVEELEQLVCELIDRRQITHAEYRAATSLIIDSIRAGEESLLFDVFWEAQAADVVNVGRDSSPVAIEGPFYLPGAPVLGDPSVMPMRADEKGTHLTFAGHVRDLGGSPIAGAELDMWQADADGLYSNIFPEVPEWNLRGVFTTGSDGSFEVTSILPPPYEIPKNGPTGKVLQALGRHFFRPAHLHVKVRAGGFEDLTSQLYFRGGEYLDSDVAGAVRDGLVVELETTDTGVAAGYDFALDRAAPLQGDVLESNSSKLSTV